MEQKKSLVKNTLTLYVRMLISMLVGLYTSRILISQLGVVDFGIYNVVGSIVILLGFLNATLSLSTQRFINYELGNGNYERLTKVYSSSIVIHVLLALLVLVFAETVGLWFLNTQMTIPSDRLTAANYVYQFSILSAMLTLTMVPHTATIIAHEHMKSYATIGIIDVLLRFGVACLLYIVNSDKLIVYGLAMFIVVAVDYSMYFLYCKKKFAECRFSFSKDKCLYKSMLTFSGWNILSSISMVLNGHVVGIILNMFLGPVVNAARGISNQVNGAVSGFVSNFQVAVNPRIIQSYASNEKDVFYRLVNQSAKMSFFLLLVLVVPIWINIDVILKVWLGVVPQYAGDFCRIVFISSLINTFSLPLATAANANGNIKIFQMACGIFEIMNIPLSYVLLRYGCPPVIVYYLALTIVVITLFVRLFVLRRLIRFDVKRFLSSIVLRCIAIALTAFGGMYALSQVISNTNIGWLLLSVIMSILFTSSLIMALGLNKEEKYYLLNVLKTKLGRG